MKKAASIKYIVIHCTAGHKNAEKVQEYFTRPKSQGGRGWNTGGYHLIIEKDGTVKVMYPFGVVTNGVKGFNSESIHISYVGGVEESNLKIAKDTRTQAQKESIQNCILEVLSWLDSNGVDSIDKLNKGELTIIGHYQFSKDTNGNGVIEKWERIKACPSFNAGREYENFIKTIAPNYKFKLP